MQRLATRQKLEAKVASIIEQQGTQPFFSLATPLLALSRLYGAAMRLRRVLYNHGALSSQRLPCLVISVGNLCLGGTGKTPMVLYLGKMLHDMGIKPVVISRGYKGLYENQGAVVSDGRTIRCDARSAGDEPYLLANLLQGVPVVVGKDRVAAGQTALARFSPDALLLDDAFQHQRLQRDLNLLLLDAGNPFGNSYVAPRGPLREPASALCHADAVILTRCDNTTPFHYDALVKRVSPRPVFRTSHRSVLRGLLKAGQKPGTALLDHLNRYQPGHLNGRRVFAFSGLAHNRTFRDSLSSLGLKIDDAMEFKDHHPYDLDDAKRIARAAQSTGSDFLVTTDKDYVRLPRNVAFSLDLIVMGIEIDFKQDQERWKRFMEGRIGSFVRKKTEAMG
jgi:tetraacyldisaccharide 4'-kinase